MPKFTRQFYLCRSYLDPPHATWQQRGIQLVDFYYFTLLLAVKIEFDTDAFEGIVFRESTTICKQSDGICYGCAK